jgi:NAD(P)-dependent dehydrogenase (short-subunit alcohol dehydrogenase family)
VSRFEDADEDDLVRHTNVNLIAMMLLIRAVVPGMVERGRGHVVNIASGLARSAWCTPAYATSKHGMVGSATAAQLSTTVAGQLGEGPGLSPTPECTHVEDEGSRHRRFPRSRLRRSPRW